MTACTECDDLRRNLIRITSEHRLLKEKTRGRHISAPERRRLHRLLTDAHLARQLLLTHQSTCEEADQQ